MQAGSLCYFHPILRMSVNFTMLIGYDIGSSSIKAALVNSASGATVAVVYSPETEMDILAAKPGWAEQDPEVWWENICLATRKLLAQTGVNPADIKAIGISYQMHGLVTVDKFGVALRPAIIWCDSRAVEIGEAAFDRIGHEKCAAHHLNSPGNFTASKLKWIKDNEPGIYNKIDKIMLPGDYIAMRLTGEICTTVSGLSEGILWDFKTKKIAHLVLDNYEIDAALIPAIAPTLSIQGKVTNKAAEATGLHAGIPVTYRAGDQPNNALSLNVLQPGEVGATGGTSGVVYGIVDTLVYDKQMRVNSFAHVNHRADAPRIGVLLCINGAGILYRWMRQQVGTSDHTFSEMSRIADEVVIGAEGLRILPFGNGAERMLGNQNIGAHIHNLQLNTHTRAHLYRAALEGIGFSFVYGMSILQEMGLNMNVIRVGNDNLFQSKAFGKTIATLTDSQIQVVETTGAVGAAKAAGVAVGVYHSLEEAMQNIKVILTYFPDREKEKYEGAYEDWYNVTRTFLSI